MARYENYGLWWIKACVDGCSILIDRHGIWVIHKDRKEKAKEKEKKTKVYYKVKHDLRLTQLTSFSPATMLEMLVDIGYAHERI
jgi:hypothetical protein